MAGVPAWRVRCALWNGFDNQFLNGINRLCYTRQQKISPVANKSGSQLYNFLVSDAIFIEFICIASNRFKRRSRHAIGLMIPIPFEYSFGNTKYMKSTGGWEFKGECLSGLIQSSLGFGCLRQDSFGEEAMTVLQKDAQAKRIARPNEICTNRREVGLKYHAKIAIH